MKLGLRLLDVLEQMGVDDKGIERVCATFEAGLRAQRAAEASGSQLAGDIPIDLDDLPAICHQSAVDWEFTTLGALEMYTRRSLGKLPGVGEKRVASFEQYLVGRGRLRNELESFAARAVELFSSIDRVPTSVAVNQALCDYVWLDVNREAMRKNGWWSTLEVFKTITQNRLRKHFSDARMLKFRSPEGLAEHFAEWLAKQGIILPQS